MDGSWSKSMPYIGGASWHIWPLKDVTSACPSTHRNCPMPRRQPNRDLWGLGITLFFCSDSFLDIKSPVNCLLINMQGKHSLETIWPRNFPAWDKELQHDVQRIRGLSMTPQQCLTPNTNRCSTSWLLPGETNPLLHSKTWAQRQPLTRVFLLHKLTQKDVLLFPPWFSTLLFGLKR